MSDAFTRFERDRYRCGDCFSGTTWSFTGSGGSSPASTSSMRQSLDLALGPRDFVTRSLPVPDRQQMKCLCLLLVLSVTMIGCGPVVRLPTAVAPPTDLGGATPGLVAADAGMRETDRGRGHQHVPPRAVIAEAKEALGAVLSGEQVYYQRPPGGTFTDVADPSDFPATLGIYFGDLLRRWAFSVSGASDTGFVATARGLPCTRAEGIVVTLVYVRGQPPSWTVEGTHHVRR